MVYMPTPARGCSGLGVVLAVVAVRAAVLAATVAAARGCSGLGVVLAVAAVRAAVLAGIRTTTCAIYIGCKHAEV